MTSDSETFAIEPAYEADGGGADLDGASQALRGEGAHARHERGHVSSENPFALQRPRPLAN